MAVSAPNRPKIPISVGRDAAGDITNHILMARTKTEERHLKDGPKAPKKKNSVRYLFYFVGKNYNKIIGGKVSEENSNRNKRNRKYCVLYPGNLRLREKNIVE